MAFCSKDCDGFIAYQYPRSVKIHSWSLFILQWTAIFAILGIYICYFQLIKNHGAQEVSAAEGVIYLQVNGVYRVNGEIWDSPEYVVPPKEDRAFIIPTSFLVTEQTTNGTCSQSKSVIQRKCLKQNDCLPGKMDYRGNGILTGNCNFTSGMCEMYAWCPIQDTEDISDRIFIDSENFTVYVRNDISFNSIDKRTSNISPAMHNATTFEACVHDPNHEVNQHCPKFTTKQIVSGAGFDIHDKSIQEFGAVIEMIISWDCDFDFVDEDYCLPTYRFQRVDLGFSRSNHYGFKTKYTEHRWNNGNLPAERVLYTMYGIRVVVIFEGEGRRFDPLKMLATIGSGLSYFGGVVVAINFLIGKYNAFCGNCKEDSCCNSCWRSFELEGRPDQKSFKYKDAHSKCCCFTTQNESCANHNSHSGSAITNQPARGHRATQTEIELNEV